MIAYLLFASILFVGVLVGKWLDVVFRAKVYRAITRKEWGILAIVSPDNKTIKQIVTNFTKDIINIHGKVWVIENQKIYRQDKPERGFRLDKVDLPKRWVDGIPCIFVNNESFLPIDVSGTIGSTNPEEVSSVFLAWVNNQLAKGFATVKNQQMLILIAVVLSLCAATLSFMAWQKTGDIYASVSAIDAKVSTLTAGGNTAVHTTITTSNSPSVTQTGGG